LFQISDILFQNEIDTNMTGVENQSQI